MTTGVITAQPAYAVPADLATNLTAAQQAIIDKQHELEVITEQYNDARIALDAQTAAAQEAQAELALRQDELAAQQEQVAALSVSLYKGPQLMSMQTLLTGESPQAVIDRLSTLGVIADHQGQTLASLQAAEQAADAAQQRAAQAQDEASASAHDIATKKAQIEAELPQLQADLAALTQQQRDEVFGAAGGHAAPASATTTAPAAAAPAVSYSGSGVAAGAVQAALSRVGKPYVYGASGPNAFDCSGLTMWAYAQVGVSLPHSSGAQSGAGSYVPLSALAPGDIVWMPGHVGMYIGGGQVVHAPTSGDVVKVVSLSSMRWQKGVRVA